MILERLVNGRARSNSYVWAPGPGADCVIVDAGSDTAKKVGALIEEQSLSPRMLLVTHGHPDHIWTARAASELYGIPVYLHRDDWRWLDNPIGGGHNPLLSFGRVLARLARLRPAQLEPVAHGDELDTGTLPVRVVHTPGHTAGSCLYIAGEVCFSGDTLFAGNVGRWTFPGGDRSCMERSVREVLLELPDGLRVLPGHGRQTTMAAEREMLLRFCDSERR